MAAPRPVIKIPEYKLTVAGQDITADIRESPDTDLLRITIEDNLEEADSVTLEFSDPLHFWKGGWYPTKSDTITIAIGYRNVDESWLPETEYQIDEIELSSWDRVVIRANSIPVVESLRTLRTEAFEDVTLKAIVQKVADRNKLTVEGEIKDITFERVSQSRESDLNLLLRLCQDYGHTFKILDTKTIVFYERNILDAADSVFELSSFEFGSSNIRLVDTLQSIYNKAEIAYSNSNKGDDLKHIETIESIESGELLYLDNRAENLGQAIAIAREQLRRANSERVTGTLDLEGHGRYNAGVNFTLTDCYKWDGKWHINNVRHQINKSSGWVTNLNIRRISE